MRGIVSVLLVLAGLSLLSFASLSNSDNNVNKSKNMEFRTFTYAVCEHEDSVVRCRDELFVNCNGKISKASEIDECNGFELKNEKVTGFASFDKNWKDPRN